MIPGAGTRGELFPRQLEGPGGVVASVRENGQACLELWLQGRVLRPNHSHRSRRKIYLTSLPLSWSPALFPVISYWASPPCRPKPSLYG